MAASVLFAMHCQHAGETKGRSVEQLDEAAEEEHLAGRNGEE